MSPWPKHTKKTRAKGKTREFPSTGAVMRRPGALLDTADPALDKFSDG